MDRYTLIKEIGKGSFGTAYIVQQKATGKRLVLKKIKLAKLSNRERQGSLNELQILSSFEHRNILKFHEAWLEGGCIVCLVVELCESGDLATQLRLRQPSNQFFPEAHLQEMLVQLASGLAHLHRHSVIHRDIKSSNVFISAQGCLKLADFGLATTTSGMSRTLVGTPGYMAPQLMGSHVEYDGRKNDIWGLACVLYEATALKPAFQAFNMASLVKKVTSGSVAPLPSHYSDEWKGIIKAMLVKEESKRPSVEDILALPWLQAAKERVAARFGSELPDGVSQVSMAHLPADIQQLADQLKQQQDEAEEKERVNRQRRKILQAKYAPKGLLQKQAQEELAALNLDTPARQGAQSAGAAGAGGRGSAGGMRRSSSLTSRPAGVADRGTASILNRVRPAAAGVAGAVPHRVSDVSQRTDTTKHKVVPAASKPGGGRHMDVRPGSAPHKADRQGGWGEHQDQPRVLHTDGRPKIMDDVPVLSLRPPQDQLHNVGSREPPVTSRVALVGGTVMSVRSPRSAQPEGIRSLRPAMDHLTKDDQVDSLGDAKHRGGGEQQDEGCQVHRLSSNVMSKALGRMNSKPSLIPTRSSLSQLWSSPSGK